MDLGLIFIYLDVYSIIAEDWNSMFDKILVPLDCSKYAETSLKVAIEIAKKFNSRLSLVHVVSSRKEYCRSGITGKIRVKCKLDEVTDKDIPKICNTLLDTSKNIVIANGISVNTILKEGKVVEEILNTIKEGEFDLVVMGSRGHSMIKKLFLGSVSNRVVQEAICPVLLTRN
jgi:nucleotide-binding universal stress UspA family protein